MLSERDERVISRVRKILPKPIKKDEFRQGNLPNFLRFREFTERSNSIFVHVYAKIDDLLIDVHKIDPDLDREGLMRILWGLSDLDLVWVPETDELSCKGTITGKFV